MRIINGIAYASENVDYLEVVNVKALDDMMMIVTFNTSEDRLFDATTLTDIPVFEVLKKDEVFKTCKIVDGILTWLDGDIDIATETLYKNSFKYERIAMS